MERSFVTVTANKDGVVRTDSMADKDYIVAPMVMMVEGVHEGSAGALYYPATELGKVPQVWNHKPVVVYHPTKNGIPISACDPDVLSVYQVGVVMNTKFEDGKLKAEAWLDPERIDKVDERIGQALENNEMMELSTGLWTENESGEGEWNGEKYTAIARNHYPDHLALLPDLTGACSIEDGGGFLRLNAKLEKFRITDNEMSHGNLRSLLNSWLQEKYPDEYLYIEDVYDAFFVYIREGRYWKMNYTTDDNSVVIKDEDAVEVVRVTEYRKLDGSFVGNQEDNDVLERTHKMEKEKIVQSLIENKATQWGEDDKESLMALEPTILEKMIPNEVEEKKETPVSNTEEASLSEQPENAQVANDQPRTDEEAIRQLPPKLQQMTRRGLAKYEEEKSKLVSEILGNEANTFTEEQLKSKDLDEIEAIANFARATVKEDDGTLSFLDYSGQGSVKTNSGNVQEPLGALTMNDLMEKTG